MKRALLIPLRPVLLLLLIVCGTALLVRVAPGYFADEREMDARGGGSAFAHAEQSQAHDLGVAASILHSVVAMVRGDLGQSRLYHVPVSDLLRPRWAVTLRLMAEGLALAWLGATLLAIPIALGKSRLLEAGLLLPLAVLLALPSGVLATLCVVSRRGGPVAVVAAVCAPRVFKFLLRLLKTQLEAPHLLYARACGLGTTRMLSAHLWPAAAPELIALFSTSVILALGAVVPVEVIFDQPGIGQLAWSAALNRDQPLLIATSLLAAGAVALASMMADAHGERLS